MTFVYALPAWLGLLFVVAVCVGLACGGHILVHRSFSGTDFIGHNEVAGFIIAIVGILYAVLLGFITIVVWEAYTQTEERAQQEVDAATDVWSFGRLLPPVESKRITDDLDRYTLAVANDEWPKMTHGQSSTEAQRLVVALIGDVAGIALTGPRSSNLQNHLFGRVQVMADLRRRRIYSVPSAVPAVIWVGLTLGACTVIGFLYLFGLRNFRVQLLMTAATAAMIGVLFGLIIELDYPFRGDVSVTPERWLSLHDAMLHEPR
ncbi:MAG: DUF4239 domain-containing protein [Candidatus Eremiobacteraeota bacterium]|nr:DUF4239 domain-containing protein [Candidatus Eremiobacteraeota bacterium]